MNAESIILEEEVPGLLDRLVCGDLDETARGGVVAWLEKDPARWRACGLAFLEAQAWSHALGEWPRAADDRREIPGSARLEPSAIAKRRANRGVRGVFTAAALCGAFCLGLAAQTSIVGPRELSQRPMARDTPTTAREPAPADSQAEPTSKSEPLMAALNVQSGGNRGPAAPIRIPVAPIEANAIREARLGSGIPEYVRQQWERRGYKISLERRYLFAQLPDGKQIVVPVDRFNVNPTPVTIN